MKNRIAVLGGSGYTGGLVARALRARSITPILLGRNERRLAARGVELALPVATTIPADVGIVIDCRGPLDASDGATEAAIETGVSVVSLAAELSHVERMLALHARASDRGVAVVVAAGFASALSEVVSWLAARTLAAPRAVTVLRAAQSSVPSLGSLRSYLVEASAPVRVRRDGGLRHASDPACVFDFAVVGPRAVALATGPELLTLPRALGASEVALRLEVGPPRLASLADARSYTQDVQALTALAQLRATRQQPGPSDDERAAMRWVVAATVEDTHGAQRTSQMWGSDPYGITAFIATEVACALQRGHHHGALTALQVLDAQGVLAALSQIGVRWQAQPARRSPIVEPARAIETAVAEGSVPALLASIVHLTGSAKVLDGPIRPNRAAIGEVQGFLDEGAQSVARRTVVNAIEAFRGEGCPHHPPPDDETLQRMMDFVAGEAVPSEYAPLMREELALDRGDARAPSWGSDGRPSAADAFSAIIIGAGMSGILAGIRLGQAGIRYTILEKNASLGGTWFENAYPGCRVDIPSHLYSYSFAPQNDWPEHFARSRDVQAYFARCAEQFGVTPHIRYHTEVRSARFDEVTHRWRVVVRDGLGERVLEANALISAVGQLNLPKSPELAGLESFAGTLVHSARWPRDLVLSGRRIGVIGTGASALQIVPELARTASALTVLQRSPPWVFPNARYRRRITEGERWLLRRIPGYGRWLRFLLFWPASDAMLSALTVDPTWPHRERSVSSRNDDLRVLLSSTMRAQLARRPDLLERLVPRYPPFAKRMLQDDGSYFAALQRPNVELVTEPVRRVVPHGLVLAEGRTVALDAVVLCTGFAATRLLASIDIIGRGGQRLSDVWGDEPRGYLGMTVPGFPNFFCLYGPGTSLAHAGSIIFQAECQVRYVTAALQELIRNGGASLDVRRGVYERYNRRFRDAVSQMVFADPSIDNWYKNAGGPVTMTSPFRLVDYWRWTSAPDPADFVWARP